jgi:putative peptidoglycan lipid II flippase
VALGILGSRVFGVVRQMLQARFLGAGMAADAFAAAFKIPNLPQNLFGEGALSGSFIPVYARLVAEGEEEEAGRVAGAVLAMLSLVVAVIVAIGVIAAPVLVPLVAAGFKGEKRELTVQLVRILFPGAGIFVLGAWTQGILNTHRRFLLSYSAGILWNVVMIGALILFGRHGTPSDLAAKLAWASVIGALAQFLVQVPGTLRLERRLRVRLDRKSEHARTVMKNFVPVFLSRGVVQISSYIDQWIATFLPNGVVAILGYAQTIYVLPVSLFGMAISAAQLPAMSQVVGHETEVFAFLRQTLDRSLRQLAYFVIPSAAVFLAFGDVVSRVLFEGGRFTAQDSLFAWGVLAGAAVGLLASTMGRLYSSTYYALRDTRTPLRFAMIRVAITTVLGLLFAIPLPKLLGIDPRWGGAGLTASAGIAGWCEFALLRGRLNQRIGHTGLAGRYTLTLWAAAAAAVAAGWGMRYVTPAGHDLVHRAIAGALVLGTFGVVYLGATIVLRIPEANTALRRLKLKR